MAPKKQVQKMSLGDFLQDSSLGNWADELEDMPVAPSGGREQGDRYDSRTPYSNQRRDGSSFSRESEQDTRIPRAQVPLPTQPPYTAHVGNLAFDLSETEIRNYFAGCKVVSVRIMKDRVDNRPKGFGYVEFEDLESLKRALTLADGQLAGRNVRVSVAEPPKSGGPHGADESSQGEWRSGKVLPPLESRNRQGDREQRFPRNFSNEGLPGAGAAPRERREMNLASTAEGVDKWERRGPLPPLESERRPRSGYNSRSGSGNFQSGPPSAGGPNRSPSRESPADTGEWRSNKSLAPPRAPSDTNATPPASPSTGGSPVMQRRKLALLPRSEHPSESGPTSATVDDAKSKANPFGAARPVDTDSALKKVEEKLAKEKEHKKEEDEKKTEERRVSQSDAPPQSKKEHSGPPRGDKPRGPHPKQLLRRQSENKATTSKEQGEVTPVVAAKAEAQEEAISEKTEGSWRKENTAAAAPAPHAEEEPGWETVPARGKKVNGIGSRH